MMDLSSMTLGEAEAYRAGLAEGFVQAKERAVDAIHTYGADPSPGTATASNLPEWNKGYDRGIAHAAINMAAAIRAMEPPA